MPQYYSPDRIVDYRSQQVNPPPSVGQDGKPKPRYKLAGGKVVERKPSDITGICVHQTACVFGVTKQQTKLAGGDPVVAKYKRLMGIPAHVVSSQTGKSLVHIPLSWYAYHGHGFNGFSLGQEIECLLPGLRGGKTWNNKPATVITDDFIEGCRHGLGYLYEEGRRAGMPIEHVWAHRQSTAKPSDPGEEIWERVVVEFGIKVLKLKPQYDLTLVSKSGAGKPIPKEWDPEATAKY